MSNDSIWPGDYKPTLDDLLSDQQPISPPFEIEIGDRLFTIALRSLSRAQVARLKLDARVYARGLIQGVELPIEDVDSPYIADLVANELELRVLWASAVDPDSEGGRGPAFALKKLRETITPPQQELLNDKWYTWQTRSAPDKMEQEDVEFIIQAARARDFFFLLKFGTGKLCNCIAILADRLASYETDKSSDGLSKTLQSDSTNESTSQDPQSDQIRKHLSSLSPSPLVEKKLPSEDA